MKNCPFCFNTDIHVLMLWKEQNWHACFCHNCGAFGPSAGNAEDAEKYWSERHEEQVAREYERLDEDFTRRKLAAEQPGRTDAYAWDDDPYVVGSPSSMDILPGMLFMLCIIGALIFGLVQWLHP